MAEDQPKPAPFDPKPIERSIAALMRMIPEGPLNAATVDKRERKRLWKLVQQSVRILSELAIRLDLIALPPLTYNPADPATFAEAIANKLIVQEQVALSELSERPFYGSGVYAIYYHGDFDAYPSLVDTNTPIYTGKADPASRDATAPADQGTRLWTRLKEHAESINDANNIGIADFSCRYLVVATGWQVAAEAHLIALFKPIWNKEMKICQGLGKHGDASETRDNCRSAWDTLHPGREWANDAKPNRRSVAEIKSDIVKHFQEHPPRL
jgi:hypothetical protein